MEKTTYRMLVDYNGKTYHSKKMLLSESQLENYTEQIQKVINLEVNSFSFEGEDKYYFFPKAAMAKSVFILEEVIL